jgi:hypothetical protein
MHTEYSVAHVPSWLLEQFLHTRSTRRGIADDRKLKVYRFSVHKQNWVMAYKYAHALNSGRLGIYCTLHA